MSETETDKETQEPSTTKVTKTEAPKPETAKPPVRKKHTPAHKKTNHQWQILGWTLVILLLVAGGGAYYVWQTVLDSKQQLETQINQVTNDVRQYSATIDETNIASNKQFSQVFQQQENLKQSINEILEKNTHLRKDWLVTEAEYLIKLASHRLMLESDINTAIAALQSADDRLRETGDPGVFSVRQTINKDIAALRAITQPDIAGMSLQLSSIVQQIDQLPLETPDPQSMLDRQEQIADYSLEDWQQLGKVVWNDLKSLVVVRQHDRPVQPLLSPEQRFFLTQNLKLQLEQARTALLHGQAQTFQERLAETHNWIKQYFDINADITQSALKVLDELKSKQIKPVLPDINNSYNALKRFQAGIPASVPEQQSNQQKPGPAPQTDKPSEQDKATSS